MRRAFATGIHIFSKKNPIFFSYFWIAFGHVDGHVCGHVHGHVRENIRDMFLDTYADTFERIPWTRCGQVHGCIPGHVYGHVPGHCLSNPIFIVFVYNLEFRRLPMLLDGFSDTFGTRTVLIGPDMFRTRSSKFFGHVRLFSGDIFMDTFTDTLRTCSNMIF